MVVCGIVAVAAMAALSDEAISHSGQYVIVTPFVTVIIVGIEDDSQSSIVIVTTIGEMLELVALRVEKDSEL